MSHFSSLLHPSRSFNELVDREKTPLFVVNYLAIFNPKLSSGHGESDEELMRSILSFLVPLTNRRDYDLQEKLRLVGLVQGINEFARNFDANKEIGTIRTIQSQNASLLVNKLERDYFLVVSISESRLLAERPSGVESRDQIYDTSDIELFRSQLTMAAEFFRFHNGTMERLLENMGIEMLIGALDRYWSDFIENWTLVTPYNGFLSVLGDSCCYKESSVSLNSRFHEALDELVDEDDDITGVLIYHANDAGSMKKSGSMYMKSNQIGMESMIVLNKWLELNDFYGLNTSSLVKASFPSEKTFHESEIEDHPSAETPHDTDDIRSVLSITSAYNPINMTINTVNFVSSYMAKMPNFGVSPRIPASEPSQIETLMAEDEDDGSFLIGLNKECAISRKIVYLETKSEGQIEYRLVIYRKQERIFVFVFESGFNRLEEADYYSQLKTTIATLQDVDMESSQLSFPQSLQRLINKPVSSEEDTSSFYFIIYDKVHNSYKSSVPWIDWYSVKSEREVRSTSQLVQVNQSLVRFAENLNDVDEKFLKTDENWFIYYVCMECKMVMILKKFKNGKKLNNEGVGFMSSLGNDVRMWFEDFKVNGDV